MDLCLHIYSESFPCETSHEDRGRSDNHWSATAVSWTRYLITVLWLVSLGHMADC